MKLKALFTLALAGLGLSVSAQTIVGTTATNKNVILEELTGKTCGYCPDGHRLGNLIKANNPGRVVLLNIHTGGYAAGTPNYRTAWGDYVGGLYSVSGYPTGAVNRTDFGSGVMHNRGQWTSNAATTLTQSSPINVGARDTIDLDNRTISLSVEAYYTAAGTGTSNKIHAVITQNNIPGPQSGASGNPAAVLPNGDYNHSHMVRYAYTPNAGDNISTITSGTVYTNSYTYTMPASINGITVNLADIETAVYVTEGAATGAVVTGGYSATTFTTSTPLGITNQAATLAASLSAVCGTTVDAKMQITNMGGTALTTATFQYTVNGGTPGTYQHTFATALPTGQYEEITIPAIPGLSPNGATSSVDISVTQLNGTANPNTNATSGLSVATAGTHTAPGTAVTVSIVTDRYGGETTWELVNETTGSTVMQGGPYSNLSANGTAAQTPVNGTLVDGDCYRFEITDSYGDGMNGGYGAGSFNVTIGGTVVTSGGNFNSSDGRKFNLSATATNITTVQQDAAEVRIMPNPVASQMTLEFTMNEVADANISIFNALGQSVQQVATGTYQGTNVLEVNTNNLVSGVYFLNITTNKGTTTKRFVVER